MLITRLLDERPILVSIARGSPNMGPAWGFTRRAPALRLVCEPAHELNKYMAYFSPKGRAALRRNAEFEAMQNLAGPVIEAVRDLDDVVDAVDLALGEGHSDTSAAEDVLAHFESDDDRRREWLFRLALRTSEELERPPVAAAVKLIAEALLDRPELSGARLVALLERVPTRNP